MPESSQAARAIELMRTGCPWRLRPFRSERLNRPLLDESALLGLELDAVLLGADPEPQLCPEMPYWRWAREQKELLAAAERERLAQVQAADRERTARAARQRAADEAWKAGETQRQIDAQEAQARQKAYADERRVVREEQRRIEAQQWELDLAERWQEQATARAVFANRFAIDYLEAARDRGWAFNLCSTCTEPFWILRDNLINWRLYWGGAPRCLLCYCPRLTERVRRENPTWSPGHVAHEVITSIQGSGTYAWAVELIAQREATQPWQPR